MPAEFIVNLGVPEYMGSLLCLTWKSHISLSCPLSHLNILCREKGCSLIGLVMGWGRESQPVRLKLLHFSMKKRLQSSKGTLQQKVLFQFLARVESICPLKISCLSLPWTTGSIANTWLCFSRHRSVHTIPIYFTPSLLLFLKTFLFFAPLS